PRAYAGMALGYATTSIGAHHVRCDWYTAEGGGVANKRLKIKSGDRFDITRREKGVANLQNLRAIDDSAINCTFPSPNFQRMINYINAATGHGYDKNSFVAVGERINNIKRVISCNLGLTRQDDKLPKFVLEPLTSGRTADVVINIDQNLKNYYEARGWDWETGRPTEEKLKELGIQ
ncbi:MAG: aldehyde ferredoxin oxidoreductase C-terminal domain-containing protein, partial [Promethearchaeota archaeon]